MGSNALIVKTRVYIAAPFSEKELARETACRFEEAGFEVTTPWWDHPYSVESQILREQAEEDLEGIIYADAFVLLNTKLSEGKAVETGYALCHGIPVIVIGSISPESNVFLYLKEVTVVNTVEEAILQARYA
jgi:nucleoside 2-deoxyribosyltransferase